MSYIESYMLSQVTRGDWYIDTALDSLIIVCNNMVEVAISSWYNFQAAKKNANDLGIRQSYIYILSPITTWPFLGSQSSSSSGKRGPGFLTLYMVTSIR